MSLFCKLGFEQPFIQRGIVTMKLEISKGSLGKTLRYFALAILAGIILLIGVFCYIYVPNPIKITDPYHQWFKPDNFRFEDYMVSKCTEKEVLAKLFPVGTNKAFVDRILVGAGDAHAAKLPDHAGKGSNAYSYFYKPHHWSNWFFPHTWNISVTYDDNDRAVNITFPTDSGGQNIYTYYRDCKFGKQYGKNWK